VLTPERMVVPARAVKAPLTVAQRPVQSMVALTVVPAEPAARVTLTVARRPMQSMVAPTVVPVARVLLTVARRPVQSMVALTVVPVAWAATAKVWLMAGPRRARAMAEPMVEQTAALVAEGSSGSW
jgi:hypothetical protein